MTSSREIVITGLGVVSPIGIGRGPFWDSLCEGRSGVRRLGLFNGDDPPSPIGGEVADFDPKQYVRPRKSLKVMSRDIQLGFAAADMAYQEAALSPGAVAPERFGVVFGADMITADLSELQPAFAGCMVDGRFDFARWGQSAMAEMFPLWMLKYLPNMPACHVGIAQDARGPNNSITLGDASSLAAMAEGSPHPPARPGRRDDRRRHQLSHPPDHLGLLPRLPDVEPARRSGLRRASVRRRSRRPGLRRGSRGRGARIARARRGPRREDPRAHRRLRRQLRTAAAGPPASTAAPSARPSARCSKTRASRPTTSATSTRTG